MFAAGNQRSGAFRSDEITKRHESRRDGDHDSRSRSSSAISLTQRQRQQDEDETDAEQTPPSTTRRTTGGFFFTRRRPQLPAILNTGLNQVCDLISFFSIFARFKFYFFILIIFGGF